MTGYVRRDRRRSGPRAASLLSLVLCAVRAAAVEPAEVVALHRAGVGREVILEQVRETGVSRPLSAADLLALHESGVDPAIVREMIRLGRAPSPPAVPEGRAVLRLTNEDEDRFCVLTRAEERRLVLYAGASQINPMLRREETRDFVVEPGTWSIAWMGEVEGVTLEVPAGRALHVITRGTEHEWVRVLHADVYDGGRFVTSRPLRVFPRYWVPRPSAVGGAPSDLLPAAAPGSADPAPAGGPTAVPPVPYVGEHVSGTVEK